MIPLMEAVDKTSRASPVHQPKRPTEGVPLSLTSSVHADSPRKPIEALHESRDNMR